MSGLVVRHKVNMQLSERKCASTYFQYVDMKKVP